MAIKKAWQEGKMEKRNIEKSRQFLLSENNPAKLEKNKISIKEYHKNKIPEICIYCKKLYKNLGSHERSKDHKEKRNICINKNR